MLATEVRDPGVGLVTVTRAKVTAGDDVLIWGIGGGVAQAALAIAKQRGARVWVTSGSDEKLEKAVALGADETINHRTTAVGKEIRARTAGRLVLPAHVPEMRLDPA